MSSASKIIIWPNTHFMLLNITWNDPNHKRMVPSTHPWWFVFGTTFLLFRQSSCDFQIRKGGGENADKSFLLHTSRKQMSNQWTRSQQGVRLRTKYPDHPGISRPTFSHSTSSCLDTCHLYLTQLQIERVQFCWTNITNIDDLPIS